MVAAALRAGADAAEVATSDVRSLSVSVRLGELEEVEREERADLGLRVFVGQRQAVVSGSDFSDAARARLVERAVAMARLAPEDPCCRPRRPRTGSLSAPLPELDLYDPTEMSPAALEEAAAVAEAAARGVAGVTNSEGATGSWSYASGSLVTSAGFVGGHARPAVSPSPPPPSPAKAAAWSAAAKAAPPVTCPTCRPRIDRRRSRPQGRGPAGRAQDRQPHRPRPVREPARHLPCCRPGRRHLRRGRGPRGVSFLKDKLGQRIFAPGIRIDDDPLRARGLGSTPSTTRAWRCSRWT